MDYSINYQFKQEQRAGLIMTWELRQAIHLLQYSTMDLHDHVYQQLSENPVLEIDERIRVSLIPPRKYDFPMIEQKKTLQEHCRDQLLSYPLDQTCKFFCNYIIDNLDENGYLCLDATEVCHSFGISSTLWNCCVETIQSLDPIGIGARSLRECIQLQLRKRGATPLAEIIVENYLEEVARGNIKKIATYLKAPLIEVEESIEFIRSCNPRPGSRYDHEVSPYIYPDIIVRKAENEYQIGLNEAIIPPLTMNQKYTNLLHDPRYQENMKGWYQSASWLIRGIQQRRHTLVRVMESILSKQKMYLENGIEYLKPLTLHQIAAELEIHESTVSRATQHKYVQTPQGTLPLRFFFSGAIDNEEGEMLSSKSVKHKIKSLIAGENKVKPYSDQQISNLLCREGIELSRRTVAKYREELGVLPSRIRKRVR